MKSASMIVAVAALAALPLAAQSGRSVSPRPPGPIGAPAGAGRYPAIAEARADAPGYTIYRPARLPRGRLPLVLWGNGGCFDNGLSASHFLREIASHGYIVVANGNARAEYPVADRVDPDGAPPPPTPGQRFVAPNPRPDETSVDGLLAGIDWAIGADANSTSGLHRRIDTSRIAVMGHSCGGLQALAAGADARIDAVVAFDSGVYVRPGSGLSGVHITKDDLRKLHTPVAYVLGGERDIAYPNGMDDFARIDHVPVLVANQPVGHGGTFRLVNGGDWARFGVAWLDWQLKDDKRAGRWFTGRDCGLCQRTAWTIARKHFPEKP